MSRKTCAEICRQTFACRFFAVDDMACSSYSSCGAGVSSAIQIWKLQEDPARCEEFWESSHKALLVASSKGAEAQQLMVDGALQHVCLGCAVASFASQCMVRCAVHGAFPDGCRSMPTPCPDEEQTMKRLSDLLRAKGAAQLFLQLASLSTAPAKSSAPRPLIPPEHCTGSTRSMDLGSMAVRQQVDPQLAAIALAASQRTCRRSLRFRGAKVNLVDLLIFVERLVPLGQVSGFFNEITENHCEMDVFSHFHKVYCVAGDWFLPAFITSGLLIHPPYGPGTWACYVPKLESHRCLLQDWLSYHRHLGIEHWTIYDLDGSGLDSLSNLSDIELVSRYPDVLGSPRLIQGNQWNPICLEAIALTQCFWRYRGRADTVFVLHSFDEFLVSVNHQQNGLPKFQSIISSADNLTVAHRIPAVNYGGDALPGDGDAAGLCGKPLIQRFPRHTGKLYWHIVAAQPDYILSVNTTSAWPQPPLKMVDFFHPDLLRLNHYIDALGARASPEVFKHKDASKVLDWGANLISAARKRDSSTVMISAMASILAAARIPHDELLTALTSLPRRSPLSRVAFDLAELEEVKLVKKVLAAGFRKGDTNSDGTLSKDEFQTLAEPLGWDAHLRRRDFHYIGLFLHLWSAEDGGLFHQIDDSEDGRLSEDEWSEGMLWLCRHQELRLARDQLLQWSKEIEMKPRKISRQIACEHHSMPISRSEAEAIFARLSRSTPSGMRLTFKDLEAELGRNLESIEEPSDSVKLRPQEVARAREMVVAMNHVLVEKHGSSLEATLEQYGQEFVPQSELRKVFSISRPLSDAQWAALLPFLHKRPDGQILWQSVLAWAGLARSPVAPASSPAVVAAAQAPIPAVPVRPTVSTPALQPQQVAPAPVVAPVPAQPVPAQPAPVPTVAPAAVPAGPAGPAVPAVPAAPATAPAIPAVPAVAAVAAVPAPAAPLLQKCPALPATNPAPTFASKSSPSTGATFVSAPGAPQPPAEATSHSASIPPPRPNIGASTSTPAAPAQAPVDRHSRSARSASCAGCASCAQWTSKPATGPCCTTSTCH
eukprot:s2015_g13.t2